MGVPLVEATGLTRLFGARVAVEDLSIAVSAGEIVTLLGPNGAGKTTTFRLLAGLIPPTRGAAAIAGTPLSPAKAQAVRARVGLLTETPGLWERLSVRWNLRTYAELHGLRDAGARVNRVMEEVGIADRAEERTGALSKGLKQRVALARALVHEPPVLLFDEPTAGLDPENARHVRDLITRLGRDGRAVMVSTHNLAEAEQIADRIAVLNTTLLACDTPARLREQRANTMVAIDVEGPAAPWADAARGAGARQVDIDGSTLRIAIGAVEVIPDIVAALARADARIRRVEPIRRSLEDAYLALVRPDD